MFRLLILALFCMPVGAQAAPQLLAFMALDRSAAILLIAALFYFGFKWRAR